MDFAIVTSPSNVRYFSQTKLGIQGIIGWWDAPKIVLFPVSKDVKPVLVANVMDAWNVLEQKESPCEPLYYGDFVIDLAERLNDQMKQLKQICEKSRAEPRDAFQLVSEFVNSWDGVAGPINVGVESHHLPSRARDMLKSRHPKIEFKDVDDALGKIRMIKTEEEVEKIRESSIVNIKGFRAALDEIRVGVKESELARAYLDEIAKYDAHPCYVMINAGPSSAAIFPSYDKPYKIRKGDTIRMDVGCEYKGYCSDVSRTVSIGNVSEEKKTILNATTAGCVETIKRLEPGLPIREIFDYAVSVVREAGIPNYRRANVGHGIGIEVHELPDLTPKEEGVLETNMVINLETPYYSFGIGGFPCEETVRITRKSYELLTRMEREIQL